MNIHDIYSTREEVIHELNKRAADKDLAEKLESFLKGNIPQPFRGEPRAILSRQMATPDDEFDAFYKKSKELGIEPIVFEYHDDLFTTNNHGKLCLAKMFFYKGLDNDKKTKESEIRSIELGGNTNENKRLRDIQTLWGENFVDFHHRILDKHYDIETIDASDWYKAMGGKAYLYYVPYIALLAVRNVLFENLEPGRDDSFFNEIFFPAVEFVEKEFGLKPLIMPIAPPEDMENIYWWSYPEKVEHDIMPE